MQEQARNRAANLAKLQTMKDAPVVEWYSLLEEGSGVRPQALEALRRVGRRQADIEEMLRYGIIRGMVLLPELDLKATPQLCQAARTFLLKNAKESRVRPKQDPRPYDVDSGAEQALPAMRWLIANGCNCDEGIAALEVSVESHIDSPARQKALASLAALSHAPGQK
jgi:hypothetical protein